MQRIFYFFVLFGKRVYILLLCRYLPEVAGEQGWTKEEALESLVKKAGYNVCLLLLTSTLSSSLRLCPHLSALNYSVEER